MTDPGPARPAASTIVGEEKKLGPVFAIVTSQSCPTCREFKSHSWPQITRSLLGQGIEVVEVEIKSLSRSEIPSGTPNLLRSISNFPTLFIISRQNWIRMMAQPNQTVTQLGCSDFDVFNARYQTTDGRIHDVAPGMAMETTDSAILSWVADRIAGFASPTPRASPVAGSTLRAGLASPDAGGAPAPLPTFGCGVAKRFTARPAT